MSGLALVRIKLTGMSGVVILVSMPPPRSSPRTKQPRRPKAPAAAAARAPKPAVRARDPGRRRRILEVAKRHFNALGYKGTNLDAVAREAGCAKGALYLEFPDKRALVHEVILEVYDEVLARYHAEVLAVESPLERVVAALGFAYRESARQPMLQKILREDPTLQEIVPPALLEEARDQTRELDRWLAEARARGELRDDVDVDAVPYVIGVLKIAPVQAALFDNLHLFPAQRTLDAVLDVFRAGIAAAPPSRSPRPSRPSRRPR